MVEQILAVINEQKTLEESALNEIENQRILT